MNGLFGRPAILLIGPTGSGKTPLGRLMEAKGFGGGRCFHFDFGGELRRCAEHPDSLSPEEMQVVEHSLVTGALLEDRHFTLALKLLDKFTSERVLTEDTLIVLNGLPRHTGQAAGLEPYVRIRLVVNLECPPEVALERIRLDTGQDRASRADDTEEQVAKRAELFWQMTMPLLDFYKLRGVPVMNICIGAATSAEDVYRQVERAGLL